MNLVDANIGEEYIIKDIVTEDEELNAFLFSLGCYSGEPITVISHIKGGCVGESYFNRIMITELIIIFITHS